MTLIHGICWRIGGRVALGLLVLLGLQGCAPSLNWREVKPPDAQGLVLMFPCQPTAQSRSVRLPGWSGQAVKMHVLTCEADGVNWALSYFDAGTPDRWREALTVWQGALQANLLVLSSPGQAREQIRDLRKGLIGLHIPGSTPHPDANTWWAHGTRPVSLSEGKPVGVRVWHFTKGLWVFQASVWAPALQPDDPRWQTFSNGIHFRP